MCPEVHSICPEVVCITVIWLGKNSDTGMLSLRDYHAFEHCCRKEKGGSAAVYERVDVRFSTVKKSQCYEV